MVLYVLHCSSMNEVILANVAHLTWEGAFSKHAVALSNQLAVPQAEECTEEIPECSLG